MDIRLFKDYKKVVVREGKYIRFLKKGGWEYVERNNCTGIVIVLAMTDEGEVIFTEQYRPPVETNVIEFTAGLVNDRNPKKKESLVTAARRELLEEAGYTARKFVQITQGPVSGGLTSDRIYMLRAFGLKKVSQGGGDGTEFIKVHEVDLKKVPRWLRQQEKKGCLVDPKVYAGLYFLNAA